MSAEDAQRWDERYADSVSADVALAPEALLDAGLIERVPTSGRALDVACGLGRQSLWLAERGLDVTALDISPIAIDRVTLAATRAELNGRITAAVFDADNGLAPSLTGFDVIVCQRFRDPQLFPEFIERLNVGGLAIVTVLSVTGTEAPGSFHAPSGELADAFDRADCTVVHHSERGGLESIIIERVAVRARPVR
ncbi:MAG: class I SAM-dependent methyltransferase [Ilumatobacter sp.]